VSHAVGDTSSEPVAIRTLATIEEFAGCVELQRAVWSLSDLDLMPVRFFVLLQQIGGLVLGASVDGALVGFVNSIPRAGDVGVRWRSHMMAVLPAFQNRGIGTALKLAQRQRAIDCGVDTIEWVFDPLKARNAHLNVVKLGAVVRRYYVNHYGRLDPSGSALGASLESDRVVAEWRLEPTADAFAPETRTIEIPADVDALKAVDAAAVREIQLDIRAAFLDCFARGFVVTGFERSTARCAYFLRRTISSA
jgi:predicted GNAT superfamily acetyltransferase